MPADWEVFLAKADECLRVAASSRDTKDTNCAANRAYYAAYLAELAALQNISPLPLPATGGWRHSTVVGAFNGRLVRRRGLFDPQIIADVAQLESLRVKADYKADHVTALEANDCVKLATNILHQIKQGLGLAP